jgi:hypothetical protein
LLRGTYTAVDPGALLRSVEESELTAGTASLLGLGFKISVLWGNERLYDSPLGRLGVVWVAAAV